MEIKSMTARFGALRGERLELAPGLNIISAPNESGKSTWCAFLRAMLYGVDSAQRARAGVLPDKRRYAPWDGGAMAGEMELRWQGQEITIARSGRAGAPLRDFSAVYTGTGLAVPELSGASAGETLTGVSQAVFASSAFIGQSGLRVSQGPELEKRIAAIVSTGDEELSCSETEKRLSAWQRKRRWRSSGELPELEARMAALRSALETLERAGGEREELAARAEALEARCAVLRGEVAESRKQTRREALERSGESREALRQTEQAAEAARSRAQALSARLEAGRFSGQTPEQAEAAARAAAARTEALDQQAACRPGGPGGLAALLVLAALLLSGGVAALIALGPALGLSLMAVGLAAAVGGFVLSRRRGRLRDAADTAAAERRQILSEFGAADEAALLEAARAYGDLYRDWQAAADAAEQAERQRAAAQARQRELDAQVLSQLDFTGGDGPAARLGRQLQTAEEELRRTREALAAANGRADVMGDPLVLRSELGELEARHGELEAQYAALSLALEALEEADREIQTRFSPRLSARAAELFTWLTGGRYDRLALDKALNAQARRTGDTADHEAAYLSAGACDQLYLALRLAICELALPQAEPCPLILDDALGSFDDARCAAALELLRDLARERQILLFTCHTREAAHFAGDPAVHCTDL